MTDDITRDITLMENRHIEQLSLDEKDSSKPMGEQQIVLKRGDAFMTTNLCGDLPASTDQVGLFRAGTRFVSACNLYIEGQPSIALSQQVTPLGDVCHLHLTNAPIFTQAQRLASGTFHIERTLELDQDRLVQTFVITSFHMYPLNLTLSLIPGADFADLFEVRGKKRPARGDMLPTHNSDTSIQLSYRGLDQIERRTTFQFEPAPHSIRDWQIDWQLNLVQEQPVMIRVTIDMSESNASSLVTGASNALWSTHSEVPIHTSDPQLNRLFTRGTYDLMMLTTMTPQGYYPYAGIPLFSCPFGRDGLISALEFLPWYPQIARGTLEFLAAHQGTKVDPFTDEEPGKILHEYRTGEMANCREIPYIPYYGSVDATALFLITLDAYLKWSNDRELLERLWPNAQAAAQWLLQNGQQNGDAFIRYHRAVATGLANQGWKDSHDSASYGDGELAPAPLALCEVQAYTFAAYRAMSTLAQIMQHPTVATQWDRAANSLQEHFLRRYWWAQEQTFYMALDGAGRPCDIVTSNAGQCLWSGIVPKEHAHNMIARLMRKDMFSGWGIRTLSTHARRYNPLSYHNGSVWPHDTALVGLGFAQYGAKTEVAQLLKGLRDASDYFEDARLPELYCGFARQQHGGPIRYAEACSPQAWSAGSPHLLLQALLGLQPHAQEKLLVLQQPTLPDWLTSLEVRNLQVGGQKAHLRFVRVGERTEIILGQENEVAIRIV